MDDYQGDSEEEVNESSSEVSVDMALEEPNEGEEQQFDKSLAASHSYMGPGLVAVRGRTVLEAGWWGRLPVTAHSGAVFPGETVPMLLRHPHDASFLNRAIREDKLFGLLCPDETGSMVSGYGVVCEVFEVGVSDGPASFVYKARARHRFQLLHMPKQPVPMHAYTRMRFAIVRVLPDLRPAEPLRLSRLASLDSLRPTRHADTPVARRLRGMDAALTPWPRFVYDLLDYRRIRDLLQNYFSSINLERLPEEPVSLSFWVASNLTLSARDQLALFTVDDALLRLHMELRFIARKSTLCCSSCGSEIARREDVFPMSSEGVHSNYTNSGGYMHDIVTVSRATSVHLNGQSSDEFSWFPGYAWTIVVCATCHSHIGWRFDALSRSLRPQQFFGLCRNYVLPSGDDEPDGL